MTWKIAPKTTNNGTLTFEITAFIANKKEKTF